MVVRGLMEHVHHPKHMFHVVHIRLLLANSVLVEMALPGVTVNVSGMMEHVF